MNEFILNIDVNCDENEDISETVRPEYLNNLCSQSLPRHELRLPQIVLLCRNCINM